MFFIFDLDGTLVDSAEDLAIAMNATRGYAGMEPLDPQVIYSYVGNGAEVLVRRALSPEATDQNVRDALAFFLRFYRQHALEHTRFYPGVREMLDGLREAKHTLAVLTNKPARISTDILRALGTGDHFLRVYGGDSFSVKKPSPVGVETLIGEARCSREETAMVGDSPVDVRTARNAGVLACGVTWGFQPDSMVAALPDVVVHQPSDLVDWAAGTVLTAR